MSPEELIYKETLFNIFKNLFKCYLFKLLTKKSSNLFLRGNDIISVHPIVLGVHEEALTKSIRHYAKSGYGDFLLDIGANIGLTSCQNGKDFKEIHMFEPNPLSCNILEVNAHIALNQRQFNLHKYGLGGSDKKSILTVPKQNWGGAFIRDSDNKYNENLLALKDGFKSIDKRNYFEVPIFIKETKRELKKIFSRLSNKGFNQGVIKIDVEGYEETILIGIANSIPSGMRIVIIFESWDSNFNLTKVIKTFKSKCKVKRIARSIPFKKDWSIAKKLLYFFINPIIRTKISEIRDRNICGDIILEIN